MIGRPGRPGRGERDGGGAAINWHEAPIQPGQAQATTLLASERHQAYGSQGYFRAFGFRFSRCAVMNSFASSTM